MTTPAGAAGYIEGVQRLSGRQWAVDIAIAVLLAAVGLVEIWLPMESVQGDGSPVLGSVAVVAFAGFIAVRRARRWWALGGLAVWPVLGVVVGPGNLSLLFFGQMVPLLVLVFTIARHGRGRYLWLGTVASAATVVLGDLTMELLQSPNEVVFHWAFLILVWLVGRGLRVFEDRAAEEAVRAHVAEAAAREQALAAIADERARIARELHDIVAHSVGTIVVQAGAAEQVVEDDPEFARRALSTIRTTGSGALTEMRRLVGVLRDPEREGDLAPMPGIAALPDLVASARKAGLAVVLDLTGAPCDLPAGLDLTVYRIVQEALTNVRRHSEATRARVHLDFGATQLLVEISDPGPARPDTEKPGHGLLGMRERVELFDGDLDIAATEAGFTVRAALPLEPT